MYQTHPSFNPPKNEDMVIWRYMDIAKFAYMLHKKALFFPKASQLQDIFEGSYTKKSIDTRSELFKSVARNNPTHNIEKQVSEFARQLKKHVYISSWHMNAHESAAMWSQYSQGGKGIAVQSTFKNLRQCFLGSEDIIFIGKVKYIDYDKDLIKTDNLLNPFIRKRKSFEHEHELRAVLAKLAETAMESLSSFNEEGRYVLVDLEELIESVYISPTSKEWEIELVKTLMEKFDLKKPLIKSNLSASPLY